MWINQWQAGKGLLFSQDDGAGNLSETGAEIEQPLGIPTVITLPSSLPTNTPLPNTTTNTTLPAITPAPAPPPQVVINMPPTPVQPPLSPTPPSISEENMRDFNKRLETMEGNMPTGMSDEALKAFNKRLEKMDGNAQGFAMMLFHENYQLRDRVRQLETRVSPEGALVLTGDDAAAWQAYQQLGKPDQVKQGLDRVIQLQGELENQRRESLLRKVAEAAHFRYQILMDRDKAARIDGRSLEYVIRDEDVNGVRTPVAYIKEGDTEQAATDYAKEHWGDYLAVLQADSQAAVSLPNVTPPSVTGTRFINQTGTSGSSGNGRGPDLVSRFQAEQEAAAKEIKNPLLR